MNFNRYVNLCRLKELERLKKHPSNKNTELQTLLQKAGFGSYRSYIRVKNLIKEQESGNNEGN